MPQTRHSTRRKCFKCGRVTKAWMRPPPSRYEQPSPISSHLLFSLCSRCMAMDPPENPGVSTQDARILHLAERLRTQGKDPARILAVAALVEDPTDVMAEQYKPPEWPKLVADILEGGPVAHINRLVCEQDRKLKSSFLGERVETQEDALRAWMNTHGALAKSDRDLIVSLVVPRLFRTRGALRQAATRYRQRHISQKRDV